MVIQCLYHIYIYIYTDNIKFIVLNLNFYSEINLSGYVGAGPPKGTGLHRYVFMIYKQKAKQTFDVPYVPNTSADHRAHFKTK